MSPKSNPKRAVRFSAPLWRYPGKGGWTFVTVPEKYAPPATAAWGRTPVVATVAGTTWKTSVWRTRKGETLLAVPRKIRGTREPGDSVTVVLEVPLEWRRAPSSG